jgi:predicted HicB family RNase H-like nuclease
MKQIPLRLDDSLHKELKHLMIDINKSLNEYFIELAKKDLEERKKIKG